MDDETRALVQRRTTIKSQLTRFKTYLEKWAERPDEQQLFERLQKIKCTWEHFEEIQSQIEIKAGNSEDSLERSNFEDTYFDLVARAECRLATLRPPTIIESSSTSVPAPVVHGTATNIKLPTINLPAFSGKYEEWMGFHDNFKSIVHDNPNLAPVQKLQYLRSSLTGEATHVIQSLETSSQNYEIAWSLLAERYDNRRVIVQSHIRALFEMPAISKESATQLGTLIDAALKHTRALQSLGQPTESWDALLLHLMTSKLDRNTHKEWERSLQGTELPSIIEFWKFLRNRCHVLESVTQEVPNVLRSQSRVNNPRSNTSQKSAQTLVASQGQLECAFCKQSHNIYQCEQFIKLDQASRSATVKSLGLCFNCLKSKHVATECRFGPCRKCKRKHNILLHVENDSSAQTATSSNSGDTTPSTSLQALVATQVLLSTASVFMLNDKGEPIKCKILLDNGSQSNFVTERCCNILNIEKKKVNVPVSGFNQSLTTIRHSIEASIKSRDGRFSTSLTFLVVSKITERLPTQSFDRRSISLPKNITLADPEFCTPSEIDALIGAELFYQLLCVGQIRVHNTDLILQKTRLGWVVSGQAQTREQSEKRVACNLAVDALSAQVAKFWEIESVPNTIPLSSAERACEKHFVETHSRTENGRYVVRLPFNENKYELGDSYQTATKRLYSLEKRLDQDPATFKEYSQFLDEYERLGHMTAVPHVESSQDRYFIPHHPVIKRESHTTKLRVVFDASARSSTGVSLNDALINGPTIQEDLFSIVTRFRTHRYALSADIEKMYRQIIVHPDDAKFQMILWRNSSTDTIRAFQLNTVTYGTVPASFLSTRVLRQLSYDERECSPSACRAVREDFYVDDLLTGGSSLEEAKKLRDEIIMLLAKGGFHLRKWCSNASSLLDTFQERSNDPHICLSDLQAQKTLGIYWHPRDDKLVHVVKPFTEVKRATKRTMLSQVASLFDPLGLLGPVIVRAKIMLQALWQIKLNWDESVPLEVATAWTKYVEGFEEINRFAVPRQIIGENALKLQLHGFCDASEAAYGAVLYLRSTTPSGAHTVRLICSKTRVAPIKRVSLPRLELCGAVLLGRLFNSTVQPLRIKPDEVYFWSDSTIALHWIQTSSHKLKTFVANRVSQIQEDTTVGKWRHVPSQDNPADALSRGQLPAEFASNDLWQNGPAWLYEDEQAWPPNLISDIEVPELRSTVVMVATSDINLLTRFSSFKRMKRVIACCLRFAANCRSRKSNSENLRSEEIEQAEICIMRLTQRSAFEKEMSQLIQNRSLDKKSNIQSLSPYVDENEIIRVGGRLKHSDLEIDEKHPVLLPSDSHVTRVIIRETHLELCHAGVQATLYGVRRKYWPLNGKNRVKEIIRSCVRCVRWKSATPHYQMGDLPRSRIMSTRPFENVGVDFCGPFLIKERKYRNRNKLKVYVAVFVCLVTKAVHIEIVSDLTTEAFIGSLKRLFARRGRARIIQSDNATNFVGAKNHLNEMYEVVHKKESQQEISRFLSIQGIKWSLIPPRSPHFGGIWEASVKSFKHHMRRAIGNALFTFEELNTFVIEVEAILNSRPLTPLSSDPNDLLVLTPAHFLINTSLLSIPEHDFTETNPNRLSTWQHIQKVKQHFWQRWRKEYLNELQQRVKWSKGGASCIKVDDLVIIKEDNTPPLLWVIGRVEKVHPGDDGIVRVITVRTANGTYKRCVKKIVPLPLE